MSVIRKNKLSDLAASVAMPKGYSANDYDFELRFFTTPESGYIVSKMGDVLTNCSIGEDGLIYARLDKHHLPVGRLRYEIGVYTPNAAWADGAKIAADAGTTNYILWDGPDDADADNVALAIPYAIVDAYAIAVSQGYQGTQSEFYEALNAMPESVASATVAANDAQSAAQSAEAAASSALIATQDAAAATQAAKDATKDAEASAGLATEAAGYCELATQEARSVVEPAHEAASLANKAAQSAEATNTKIATAEQSRVKAENARVEAEKQRADAESARQSAEASRVDAENARVEAEKQREADVQKLVSDADATIATNTAKANEAIQTQIDLASKGKPNGVASLDGQGRLEINQFPNLDDLFAYGIEFDVTVSSPKCTRIGNATYHRTLPVQSQMRGCLLDDNGEVVEYLPEDDWTDSVRDGSKGQVMVELPHYYRKFETVGNKRRVWLSLFPLDGYHEVAKQYISAYEATVQRSAGKLCSVVNKDADYRGGGNASAWDDTYKSMLGMPATNISRTNFRKYARSRGVAGLNSCGWNCYLYTMHRDLYWLFATEYATLNSQADYNAELTSEGYRQGGLGAGVTKVTSAQWSAYNGYYPLVNCGYTDSLGNATGCVDYDLINGDGVKVTTVLVIRYRGIENPFGHIWKWADGLNIMVNPSEANGGNGLSEVYVAENPSAFNDKDNSSYNYVGNYTRSNGWIKSILFGDRGHITATTIGGGSTVYFCDYNHSSVGTSAILRGLILGGYTSSGANAGLSCTNSLCVPSYTGSNLGSRLCFLPQS